MTGQTYSNSGCDFFFDGPRNLYSPSGEVCPSMARMVCYIFNGGVCCTSECPGVVALFCLFFVFLFFCLSLFYSSQEQLINNCATSMQF